MFCYLNPENLIFTVNSETEEIETQKKKKQGNDRGIKHKFYETISSCSFNSNVLFDGVQCLD